MKISLYEYAEQCLYTDNIEEKLYITDETMRFCSEQSLYWADDPSSPRPVSEVSFPSVLCSVEPRQLPRRTLGTEIGRAAFLHALAHIEFTAIHLAWDMLYRFRGMPGDFYRNWLQVAYEEADHFCKLRDKLRTFGVNYGDFPVHKGLWELAEETDGDVLHRLALIPRFMEARGLDVTPSMITKLEQIEDVESASVLKQILEEEIGHVAYGSHWFMYVCHKRHLDPESEYFALVKHYLRGAVHGPFNKEARRKAGFSETELAWLNDASNKL